ncbi:hypothetical protein DVJ78_06235 [Humibacter sp. BT305]|nr:hypothetical protein DVJ78_06235 [Humibacter sp. BT305]
MDGQRREPHALRLARRQALSTDALLDRLRDALRDPEPVVDSDPRLASDGVSNAAALAALRELEPEARERQLALGIPADVVEATLGDLRRSHRPDDAASVLDWMIEILRGDVVQIGRLQVERRAGEWGYALHIPQEGPLDPESVDASLARIRSFTGSDRFSCTSWLLDPVLQGELPASNIAAFARRFELVLPDHPSGEDGAEAAARFVFRRPLAEVLDPAAVVPRTSLERLVAGRLRAGRGWTQPVGVLRPV